MDLVQPADGPIVRHFEPPPTPYSAGHRGIDFDVPLGSPVVAAAAGTVAFAGQVGGALFVSIDHPNGLRSTYSYLSAILVKKGQLVEQGRLIARSGPGAAGEDPNLHFGIRSGVNYLDPEPLLLESIRRNVWRVIWLAPTA
jgi:murein DD-endopeptidase MepM/ murein hydrolase activator NlpD